MDYKLIIFILALVITNIMHIFAASRERAIAKLWEEQATRALNTIKELEDIINSKQK